MTRPAILLIGITVAIMAAAIALVVLPGKTVAPTATPASKDDLIRVTSPLPGEKVSFPLVVTGEARGNWYFEADFFIELYGDQPSRHLMGNGIAQAQGEWMTTEYVPFIATINHSPGLGISTGELILYKNNASGLPEHDNQLVIPVQFDPL